MNDFILENDHTTAALYFLERGHYLFRYKDGKEGVKSKTLAAPDVKAAFMGKDFDSGFLPNGVVRFGSCPDGDWAVYTAPAQAVKLTLAYPEGDREIEVRIPATLLVGIGKSYSLFALGSNDHTTASVYTAPFPNISRSGGICFGSNPVLPARPANMRRMWELFFGSPFSNHLADKKSKKYPEDVREMLNRSAVARRPYPLADLNFETGTVRKALDIILRGYIHAD